MISYIDVPEMTGMPEVMAIKNLENADDPMVSQHSHERSALTLPVKAGSSIDYP